jgi:transposase-like protein
MPENDEAALPRKRATHTPEMRERALALAAEKGPEAAARELGVAKSAIYTWRKRAKATEATPGGPVTLMGLPTTRIHQQKPRPLVPVQFKCPHCGGTVILPEGTNHG